MKASVRSHYLATLLGGMRSDVLRNKVRRIFSDQEGKLKDVPLPCANGASLSRAREKTAKGSDNLILRGQKRGGSADAIIGVLKVKRVRAKSRASGQDRAMVGEIQVSNDCLSTNRMLIRFLVTSRFVPQSVRNSDQQTRNPS